MDGTDQEYRCANISTKYGEACPNVATMMRDVWDPKDRRWLPFCSGKCWRAMDEFLEADGREPVDGIPLECVYRGCRNPCSF